MNSALHMHKAVLSVHGGPRSNDHRQPLGRSVGSVQGSLWVYGQGASVRAGGLGTPMSRDDPVVPL